MRPGVSEAPAPALVRHPAHFAHPTIPTPREPPRKPTKPRPSGSSTYAAQPATGTAAAMAGAAASNVLDTLARKSQQAIRRHTPRREIRKCHLLDESGQKGASQVQYLRPPSRRHQTWDPADLSASDYANINI